MTSASVRTVFELLRESKISRDTAARLLHALEAPFPVAVIGLSARMPGVHTLDEFWAGLCDGRDFVGSLPRPREQDVDAHYRHHSPDEFIGPKRYFDAAYLTSIDEFDAGFFGISRAEAEAMDPAHRLFLETSYHALEDAALSARSLDGTRTGVFVGNSGSNYREGFAEITPLAVPGNLPPFLGARLSYHFNLKGPAFSVQSTCSSSMVALHQACQSLRVGDCDLAIVGGATVFSYPGNVKGVFMTAAGIVAEAERSRPFDDNAGGMGRGEGVIALLLMPLQRAIRDRHPVHCVILGSAINNDGHSAALTAPDQNAQADVLERAWKAAGIEPSTLSYIEAHGTGTKLGDPIEVKGLSLAFGKYTTRKQFCGIGSIKGNIGHLIDGAAGMSGLLKVILSLRHGSLPPTIHLKKPNRHIDFINSPVYPVAELTQWISAHGAPRRAGVSCFSFNGTNVHVVVQEAPPGASVDAAAAYPSANQPPRLFLFSAKSDLALGALLGRYRDFLEIGRVSLQDLAHTLAVGRDHFGCRAAFVASTQDELLGYLAAAGPGRPLPLPNLPAGDPRSDLGTRYMLGEDLTWADIGDCAAAKLRLPEYPFERSRYWLSEPVCRPSRAGQGHVQRVEHASIQRGDIVDRILGVWHNFFTQETLHPASNFFELGGTSLHLMQLQSSLKHLLGVELPFSELFRLDTPAKQADAYLDSLRANTGFEASRSASSAPPVATGAVSTAQQAFWFLLQMEGDTPFYHAPIVAKIRGPLAVERLHSALKKIHRRHDLLRTRFVEDEDGLLSAVLDDALELDFSVIDLQYFQTARMENALRVAIVEQSRRFHLHQQPPWRCRLIVVEPDVHVICLVFHHIVADMASLHVVWRELQVLYNAGSEVEQEEGLSVPAPQYRRFIEREKELLAGGRGDILKAFWRNHLENLPAPVELPTDRPRRTRRSFHGDTIDFDLPPELAATIRSFSSIRQVTPFIFFLALFGDFIAAKAGCREFVVGTESMNRTDHQIARVVGSMVNQIPILLRIGDKETFESWLRSVQNSAMLAIDHQDFPFGQLTELLKLPRGQHDTPLIRVKLLMDSFRMEGFDLCGAVVESLPMPIEHSPFDLVLRLIDRGADFSCRLSYSSELFDRGTVEGWIEDLLSNLRGFLARPELPLRILKAHRAGSGEGKPPIRGRRKTLPSAGFSGPHTREAKIGWRFPLIVEAGLGMRGLASWIAQERRQFESWLLHHGAILFRGFDVTSIDEFESVARAVHPKLVRYREPSTPRTEYRDKIYISTQYPKYHEIHAHSELSYTHVWPMKALFMCRQAASSGGETPLADNREILGRLPAALRRRFMDLGVMYLRNYGDGLILPWQKVFDTDSKSQVEVYCRQSHAMSCEWKEDGGLRTRQLRHAVIRHPDTEELVWFNQAHLFHIDSLGPEVAADLRSTFAENDLPVHSFFGDGSAISTEELNVVVKATLDASYYLPWEPGDVMVLDNVLVSHGRNSFEGDREVAACFVEPRRDVRATP